MDIRVCKKRSALAVHSFRIDSEFFWKFCDFDVNAAGILQSGWEIASSPYCFYLFQQSRPNNNLVTFVGIRPRIICWSFIIDMVLYCRLFILFGFSFGFDPRINLILYFF